MREADAAFAHQSQDPEPDRGADQESGVSQDFGPWLTSSDASAGSRSLRSPRRPRRLRRSRPSFCRRARPLPRARPRAPARAWAWALRRAGEECKSGLEPGELAGASPVVGPEPSFGPERTWRVAVYFPLPAWSEPRRASVRPRWDRCFPSKRPSALFWSEPFCGAWAWLRALSRPSWSSNLAFRLSWRRQSELLRSGPWHRCPCR